MRYLSLEWIDAMKVHVAASESLAQLGGVHFIGITQEVTDGPEGTVLYYLQLGDSQAEFGAGSAPSEHVRFVQSWETAVGVATETIPAQEAFIKGLVRITGDAQRLIEAVPVFAALDSAFEAVRALTEYS